MASARANRPPSHSSLDKDDLDGKHQHVEHREIALQTPMERQMALQAALKVDPGVARFSWAAYQVRVSHL